VKLLDWFFGPSLDMKAKQERLLQVEKERLEAEKQRDEASNQLVALRELDARTERDAEILRREIRSCHELLEQAGIPYRASLALRVKLLVETKHFVESEPGKIVSDNGDKTRTYYFVGMLSRPTVTRIALFPGIQDMYGGQGHLAVVRGDSATWDNLEPFILDQISRECRIGVYAPRQIEAGKGE